MSQTAESTFNPISQNQGYQQSRSGPAYQPSNLEPSRSPQNGRPSSLATHLASPGTPHHQQYSHPGTPYQAHAQTPTTRPPPSSLQYQYSQVPQYAAMPAYTLGGSPEGMAAMHPIRVSIPGMYTNQPPSPATIRSPQEGLQRNLYGYPMGYYPLQQSPNYTHQPGPAQHSPNAPRAQYGIAYPQYGQHAHHSSEQVNANSFPTMNASPIRSATTRAQAYAPLVISPSRSDTTKPQRAKTSGTTKSPPNQAAAPGPIPATTPLVSETDAAGVQWITFEYSRDRIKVKYVIRCDTHTIDTGQLTEEYKTTNCIYSKAWNALRGIEEYKSNRYGYECQCNEIGWALSRLNQSLQGKRGLIQRAVDSFRNSNADVKSRSRRVRRLAKNQKRSHAQQQIQAGAQLVSAAATGPATRRTGGSVSIQQPQTPSGMNDSRHPRLSYEPVSEDVPRSIATPHDSSPHVRYAQGFAPLYPADQQTSNFGPLLHQDMRGADPPSSSTFVSVAAGLPNTFESQIGPLRDLPYGDKRKKNITLKDQQRDIQTCISVRLDASELDTIPDNHRFENSVFPRSHHPRQPPCMHLDDSSEPESSLHWLTTVQIKLDDGFPLNFRYP